MLSTPRFNLKVEKTWALYLGLIFFSLLSILLFTRSILDYLPLEKKKEGALPAEIQEALPKDAIDQFKLPEPPKVEKEVDHLKNVIGIFSAIAFFFGVVVPIYQTLRSRHQARQLELKES